MDATSTLLRAVRTLALRGIRIDYAIEVMGINPANSEPTSIRVHMDERIGPVEYNMAGAARVGDFFLCGEHEGKLVAYRVVPQLIEVIVVQPKPPAPETLPGIDVDAAPKDPADPGRTL